MSDPITAAPEKASAFEDIIDMFFSPSKVFERRRNEGGVWLPLIITSLVFGLGFLFARGVIGNALDAEINRGMAQAAKNPQMTPDLLEKGRAFAGVAFSIIMFLRIPIAVLFSAFCLWLFGKLLDARATWHAFVAVATLSNVPRILETIIWAVQGLVLDTTKMNGVARLIVGPVRFLDPDTTSPAVMAMLGRVDLFTIWVTILMGIGVSVVARVSRGKGMIVALITFVAGALYPLMNAMKAAG